MKKIFLLLLGLVSYSAFAVTPADPTNVTWYDCGDESGHSYLSFTLPTVDVDGNPLDEEMMGYRIYTDNDQIFTFNSAVYDNVWGSTTDVYSYSWEAGTDIQSGGVYFYRTNADGYDRFFNNRIGIQVFYLNNNFSIGGVSNIVYYELAPVASPLTPATPELEEFIDYGLPVGMDLHYTIKQDFDGNLVADDYTLEKYFAGEEYGILDPDKVSFSILTDNDQILTLTPEMFPDAPIQVTEPMTQFPYNERLPNGSIGYWDIHFKTLTNIVEEGEEPVFTWRIGMQVNYTDNGQTTSSEPYYMEVYPQLKEAAQVTPTSFLADWSCDAENTYILGGFQSYDLYIINMDTQETTVIEHVVPTNSSVDEWGNDFYLPGATQMVEGLTPGTTYQFYVVCSDSYNSFNSAVREVTLPQEGHGYELGDVNHDQTINISDLTVLIDYLLGSATDACEICADVNADGDINIADVTALVDMLLGGN